MAGFRIREGRAGPDDPLFSGPRIAFPHPSATPTPDTSEGDRMPSFKELAERPITPEQLRQLEELEAEV